MNDKWIRAVFWATVAVFILMLATVFIPQVNRPLLTVAIYALIALGVILFLLGAALIWLTLKQKVNGKPRIFLLLTGAAAAGMPVFSVLHNLVSGLLGIEEAVFFTLSIIVCPVGFLAGAIGVIVLTAKNKEPRS